VETEDSPSKGTWDDITHRLSVGLDESNMQKIVDLFDYHEFDKTNLSKLRYGDNQRGSLGNKKYKHLCYMFETFFQFSGHQTIRKHHQNPWVRMAIENVFFQ
jgi:hypothetical protein